MVIAELMIQRCLFTFEKGLNMKKENILVVAIVIIAVLGFMIYNNSKSYAPVGGMTEKQPVTVNDESGIDWQDFEKGLATAKAEKKHVFLYFHADWCTYCKKLKKTTFKDKKVLAFLEENFISISVDTDHNMALAEQWRVKGLPTMWFLKSDSSKVDYLKGFVDETQFLTILNYIHTKLYEKMSFNQYMETQ